MLVPPFVVAFEPHGALRSGTWKPQARATNMATILVGNCGQRRRSETVLVTLNDLFSRTRPSFEIPQNFYLRILHIFGKTEKTT